MFTGGMKKSVFAGACALMFFAGLARAVEVVAQKSDTFIFETMASGEFSKSDFLATAHVKGEQAIAYLPFELKTEELGVQPACDSLTDCSLTLFIKSLPLLPDSNASNSPDIAKEQSKREIKLEESKDLGESLDEKASEVKEYAAEKLEEESKSKIVIEVFGITDRESFEPNSRDFRVSWDGKIDAVAPKHNTMDNQLEETGLFPLGKIEIDLEDDEYENGDRYEFSSPELKDFLRFAMGITSAHGEAPPFRTPLRKIENACIVLRQKSGPSGVFCFSADSMGDNVGKEQSGDEVEKHFNRRQKTDPSGNVVERDESAAAQESERALKEGAKERFRELENASIEAGKPQQESSGNKDYAGSDASQNAPRIKTNADGENAAPPGLLQKNDPPNSLEDGEIEFIIDEKPDRRPRINFEFRRESGTDKIENIAPDDSVQTENLKGG